MNSYSPFRLHYGKADAHTPEERTFLEEVSQLMQLHLKTLHVDKSIRGVLDLKGDFLPSKQMGSVVRVRVGGKSFSEQIFGLPHKRHFVSAQMTVCLGDGRELDYGEAQVRVGSRRSKALWIALAKAVIFHFSLALTRFRDAALTSDERSSVDYYMDHNSKLVSLLKRLARLMRYKFFVENRRTQWAIGLGVFDRFPEVHKTGLTLDQDRLKWLIPPKDRFWADPFLFRTAGRTYLFFEELFFSEDLGRLAWVELLPQLTVDMTAIRYVQFDPPVDTHVSFPYLFNYQGRVYAVAEAAASHCTTLYTSAKDFGNWNFERVLLPHVCGIDPVMFEHGGRIWLFVSDATLGNHDNHLLLYSALDLDSEFVEHPCSPIKVGLRGSRMAGAIISADGKLLRPGQDCSELYGSAVRLYRIVRLDETSYEEVFECELSPNAKTGFPHALHTVSYLSEQSLMAIDAARRIN
jgi:hypothetical protein